MDDDAGGSGGLPFAAGFPFGRWGRAAPLIKRALCYGDVEIVCGVHLIGAGIKNWPGPRELGW
jgi:hypothetical protein